MSWTLSSPFVVALSGCLLLTCSCPSPLRAQTAASPVADSPNSSAIADKATGAGGGLATVPFAKIQQLIEQLGSDRFIEREAASIQLLKVGEPALLPLAAAEQSRDAEIRSRAAAIRDRIERVKFEGIANSFKKDDNPEASYGLPGWKSFSKVAGASRPAKRLFLDFIDQRRIVALCLESIDGGQIPEGVFEGLPEDPQLRLKSVIGQACAEIRTSLLLIGNPAKTGDLISMLVAVEILEEPNQDVHEIIRLQCNMGSLMQLMNNPGAGPSVRRLLGGWFLKAPTSFAFDVFTIGRLNHIPETADMARRVLSNKADPEAQTAALLAFSLFGNTSDLALIEKFIDETQILRLYIPDPSGEFEIDEVAPPNLPPNIPKGRAAKQYGRTLGDVALAVAMKIAGMDVSAYIPGVQIDDSIGIREGSIGFPVDQPEARAAALKAYRELRAKQKPSAS